MFERHLMHMWPESSSVKAVNLVKKSIAGIVFIGAPCKPIHAYAYIIMHILVLSKVK